MKNVNNEVQVVSFVDPMTSDIRSEIWKEYEPFC